MLGFEPLPKNYEARTIFVVWPEGNWKLWQLVISLLGKSSVRSIIPQDKEIKGYFLQQHQPRTTDLENPTRYMLRKSKHRTKKPKTINLAL